MIEFISLNRLSPVVVGTWYAK